MKNEINYCYVQEINLKTIMQMTMSINLCKFSNNIICIKNNFTICMKKYKKV